jgi:uncharacterized membrane protein
MDQTYLSDWAHLLLRWGHLVFGAAWIGTSFYFNWLNNQLRPPVDPPRGVGGELWAVHGGYFYRVLKYQVAPEKLPDVLHWFKWEAYLTWLTGIGLMAVVYYLQAELYLAGGTLQMSGAAATHIGVGVVAGGFVAYHFLCKTPLVDRRALFAGLMLIAVGGIAFGLTRVMNPRGAYMHVGALLGTCMALNVFFVIIPNQRKMVADLIAGREPDAVVGKAGALRSLHNNYMTLPVLWIMVSNHFPHTFGHAEGWAVLAAVTLIGGGVRHWFNLRGRGIGNTWLLPAAAVATALLIAAASPAAKRWLGAGPVTRDTPVTFGEVQAVITTRCTPCHANTPTMSGFPVPPKGLVLETPAQIKAQAGQIDAFAVRSVTMPLGNLTQMTDEERAILARWISQGAPLE